jgi:hypothetical protein
MSEPEKESLGRSLAFLPVKVILRWGICSLIALVGLAILGIFETVTRAVTTDPFWMLVVIILLCLLPVVMILFAIWERFSGRSGKKPSNATKGPQAVANTGGVDNGRIQNRSKDRARG